MTGFKDGHTSCIMTFRPPPIGSLIPTYKSEMWLILLTRVRGGVPSEALAGLVKAIFFIVQISLVCLTSAVVM